MDGFENIIDKLLAISVWEVAKVGVLLFLLIYIVFSIVVIRQINLMSQALNGALNVPLKVIAWLHFGMALFVFFLGLVVL